MTRYLLALFFFILYAGNNIGLNISLMPGISLKNLLLYGIFCGIAINAAVARNRSIELSGVLLPFGAIIIYALITCIAAGFIFNVADYDVRASVIRLKSQLVDDFITFIVFFYGVLHARDARWLLRALIWIAVVGNIITLIDAFDVPNLGIVEAKPSDGRFLGFIGSANDYGSFLTLFLPASIALYYAESGIRKKWAALGVLSTAFALVLTFSRGAYVSVIVGSVVAAVFLRHLFDVRAFFRSVFIAVAVGTALVAVAIAIGYTELFQDRLGRFEGSTHVATSGRSTIWTNAIRAMLENPITFITGTGYNAYETSRQFYAATHNHYLNYLYNLGVIGLFLFVYVFIATLLTARSSIEYADQSARPFLVAAIVGLFGFMFTQLFGEYKGSGILTWAYLGVIMRLSVSSNMTSSSTAIANQVELDPQKLMRKST